MALSTRAQWGIVVIVLVLIGGAFWKMSIVDKGALDVQMELPSDCLHLMLLLETGTIDTSVVPDKCFAKDHGQCRLKTPNEGFVRVSIVAAVRNRAEQLKQTLPSWLLVEGVDEIVIVDFSSEIPIASYADEVPALKNEKVRIIFIEEQPGYVLSIANNIGFHMSRGAYILKVAVGHINRLLC